MLINTALPLRSRERKQLVSPQTRPKRLTITSILVPIDFSPASFNALDFALPLAERFDASVHLVHVFDFDYPPSMLAAMPMIIPESRLADNAKRRLKDIARKLALSPHNLHVVSGRAYRAICELARKIGIELIITAASGQSALEHVLLGSTAERIVQHAPCPTLVVRGRQRSLFKKNGDPTAGRATHLRKILIPLDFSNCSMIGLEYAIRLGETSSAELVLLNSVSVPSFAPYGAYGDRGLPVANHYAWLTAEKEMSQLRSTLVARGIEAETVIESGVPAHQICLYAQNHEVDLIVTATHGRTGLKHLLLGSTAEQIVRHGPCPVLVVPSKETSRLQSDGRGVSERDVAKFAMQTNTRRAAITSLQRLGTR
jgi:nucleotide-binding universal stress UspA family protein